MHLPIDDRSATPTSAQFNLAFCELSTPAAALEAVPDVVDGDVVPAAAADALELEGEQPPF